MASVVSSVPMHSQSTFGHEYRTSNKAVSVSLLFQNPSRFDVTFKYSKKYLKIQDFPSTCSEMTKNQHVLLQAIKIVDPLSFSFYSRSLMAPVGYLF